LKRIIFAGGRTEYLLLATQWFVANFASYDIFHNIILAHNMNDENRAA
jgi:hypothetical protein